MKQRYFDIPLIFPRSMNYDEEVMLDQYRMLRLESIALVDETRKIEVMVVAAIAALYAWVFTTSGADARLVWIGPCLCALGALRAWGLFQRTQAISKYMKLIEAKWFVGNGNGPDSLCGWERHLHGDVGIKGANEFYLSVVAAGVWLVLFSGTCAISFAKGKKHSGDDKIVKVELVQPALKKDVKTK